MLLNKTLYYMQILSQVVKTYTYTTQVYMLIACFFPEGNVA